MRTTFMVLAITVVCVILVAVFVEGSILLVSLVFLAVLGALVMYRIWIDFMRR